MRLPAHITAGDSATWLDDAFVDDQGRNITSADYALTYSVRGPAASGGVDLVAVASGAGWSTTLTTGASGAMNTGSTPTTWYWQAYATKAGERITAGKGSLRVLPNLAGLALTAVFDGTTQNEQILAAVRAEILARKTNGFTTEYTIGSRSLKKEPLSALLELESKYAWKVARERRSQAVKNGLGRPGRIGVRF